MFQVSSMLFSLLHGPNNEKMILKWHSYRSRSGSTVNYSWQQWTSPRTIETTYSYPLYKWVTVTIMLVHQSLAILHTSYVHVCWVNPPWLLVTCFAGEHDHHKMGCISHQEQWVITFILMLLHLLVTLYKLGQSWYHPVIKRGNWNTQDSFSHCNTHLVRGFSIAMFD